MTKLIYPDQGLNSYVSNNLSSCHRYLTYAIGQCDFSVPTDYEHANYLRSLRSKLETYLKEIDDIRQKIIDTDKTLENLNYNLTKSIPVASVQRIKEIDKMIK